jgi:uncharacterized protein (DUF58 family)
MQTKYISYSSPPSLLRKTATVVATVALAGVALMFSAVLLAVVFLVAAFGGAYLWWKTRELRRQMRDFAPRAPVQEEIPRDETVVEGEVISSSWERKQ